ncbi:class II aldolase/adducin family protein [bacterium]|nr:class II aldolase/adducin family protein [candidate division CSSED10-310 bacterium]
MANLHQLKKQIIDIGKLTYNRGFVAANDGNISARLDDNRIVITPTGVSKGALSPETLVICDMSGKALSSEGKPSSEILMHLKVYQLRKDIFGIVHAHPPYATAFGIAGIPLSQAVLPEVIMTLGAIPLVKYGTPGTQALSEPLTDFLPNHDAFILQNHGALAIGKDLQTAYFRMETLEHFAHIAFVSYLLGKIHTLPDEEVKKLLQMRAKSGFTGEFQPVTCEDQKEACAILEPGATLVGHPSENTSTSKSSDSVTYSAIQSIVADIIDSYLKK